MGHCPQYSREATASDLSVVTGGYACAPATLRLARPDADSSEQGEDHAWHARARVR